MPATTGPERRLHPSSFLFSMGAHLKALLVPGIAVAFTAGSRGRDWEVWLMVLLVPYTIAAILRSLSFRYRFDAEEMVVRRGFVFRSERHIPYARIQNIDATRNVFHRLLGVAEIRVETASGGEPEATMTVLPLAALDEMRRAVFAGRQDAAVEAGAGVAADEGADVLLRLGAREVLLYGFIESRGAVVVAGAVGLMWEFGLFERYLQPGLLRQLARAAFGQGAASPWTMARAAAALVALLFVMRVLSMAWAFVRLYGFTLRRSGDDLRVDYGLFTRISGTIPLQRIQTLTRSDSPLHRAFDRVSVHVSTAGGAGGEAEASRREPIAPLLPRARLEPLIAALLPSVPLRDLHWHPPHPRARRRVLVRGAVVVAIAAAMLAAPLGRWTLAAVAVLAGWAWVYAGRYAASLGWTISGDAVAFRSGWLWRHLTVARFSKIQVVSRVESPFDRRMGMATVAVDTAGAANAEHDLEIPFLPAAAATDLAGTLAAHAAQTAFRW